MTARAFTNSGTRAEARDSAGLLALYAEDAVLESPLVQAIFDGRGSGVHRYRAAPHPRERFTDSLRQPANSEGGGTGRTQLLRLTSIDSLTEVSCAWVAALADTTMSLQILHLSDVHLTVSETRPSTGERSPWLRSSLRAMRIMSSSFWQTKPHRPWRGYRNVSL